MLELCDKERKAQGIHSPHKWKNMTRDEARLGMVDITCQLFQNIRFISETPGDPKLITQYRLDQFNAVQGNRFKVYTDQAYKLAEKKATN